MKKSLPSRSHFNSSFLENKRFVYDVPLDQDFPKFTSRDETPELDKQGFEDKDAWIGTLRQYYFPNGVPNDKKLRAAHNNKEVTKTDANHAEELLQDPALSKEDRKMLEMIAGIDSPISKVRRAILSVVNKLKPN